MRVQGRFLVELVFLTGFSHAAFSQELSASDIIKRSVAANTADWKAQLSYNHRETDIKSDINSSGKAIVQANKTYEVLMMDGSPYNELVAVKNEPLSPNAQAQEQKKLQAEIHKRKSESSSERQKRIAQFRSERSEEHLLMDQMTKAFQFKLAGEERLGNVDCYVLDATPDPNYTPPVQKAKVLTGMKGKLWIEKTQFHWAKVEAQVISPVEFALFIAKVKPGTKFELEQSPVGNVWLPCEFSQTVNASVLGVYNRRNEEQERYFDYRPVGVAKYAANLASLPAR